MRVRRARAPRDLFDQNRVCGVGRPHRLFALPRVPLHGVEPRSGPAAPAWATVRGAAVRVRPRSRVPGAAWVPVAASLGVAAPGAA